MPPRINTFVGHKGSDNPAKPYVELEVEDSWLTPAQARKLAYRLFAAAERAEKKYEDHKTKKAMVIGG